MSNSTPAAAAAAAPPAPDEASAAVGTNVAPPRARGLARRAFVPLLRVSVAVGLLAFVLWHADVETVARTLAGAAWGWYAAGAAVVVLAQGLLVANLIWGVRALGGTLSPRDAVRAHAIGLAANVVLPSSIGGDAVKALAVRRGMAGMADAAAAVLLARGIGIVGLLANAAIGLAWTWPALAEARLAWPAASIVGGLLLAVVLGWSQRRRLVRLVRRRSPGWLGTRLARVLDFIEAAPARAFTSALAIGWVYSLAGVLWYGLFAVALGLDLTVPQVMTAVTLVYLLTLLPISVQGIGLREVGYVTVLGAFAVPAEPAIAFALLAFTAPLLGAAVGAAWLGIERRRWADIDAQ